MPLIPRYQQRTSVPLGGQARPQLNLPGGDDFRTASQVVGMVGQGVKAVDDVFQRQADAGVRAYRDALANRKLGEDGLPIVSAGDLENSLALRMSAPARSKFRESVQGYRLAGQGADKQLGGFKVDADLQRFASTEAQEADKWDRAVDGRDPMAPEQFITGYEARAEAFLQTVPEEFRPQTKVRLEALRGGLVGQAEKTYYGKRDGWQLQEIATVEDTAQKRVRGDITSLQNSTAEVLSLVEKSDLPASKKAELKTRIPQSLQFAAAEGLIRVDPGAAQRLLGGPTTVAGDYDLSGAKGDEAQSVAFWRSEGLPGAAVAGVLGTFAHEGGSAGTGAVNRGDGADGSDSIGKAQWNAERAAELKKFAAARGKSWKDNRVQDEFALMELKRDHPDVWRRLKAVKTPAEAVAIMNDFERPAGWKPGGDPTKVAGYANRVKQAERIAGKVASETTGGTNAVDPRFKDLSYEDVVKLSDFADRQHAENEREAEAAEAKADAEQVNTLELGLMDGSKGQADIDAARRDGYLRDASDVSRAEGILAEKQKATIGATGFAAMMNAGQTFDPFDNTQQKAADAYFLTSTDKSMGAAFNILQRTGILPPAAGSVLRGGLYSTDPAQVARAGSLGTVMLDKNPQAFNQLEGGDGMRERAILYRHYTQDLLMTADDAAKRVIQENSPEYKSKAAPKDKVAAYQEKLKKQDPGKVIIDAVVPSSFGGGFGRVGIGGQVNPTASGTNERLKSDFNEFAVEGFKIYGDEGAAQAYAKQRIGEFWGVTRAPDGNSITRYAAEKLYQEPPGGWNKLYEQAAGDASFITKQKVAREDVFLIPIPTVTAETWRNGGRPPYQLVYRDRSGGIPVLKTIPGEFEFDAKVTGAPTIKSRFERMQGLKADRRAVEAENAKRRADSLVPTRPIDITEPGY